MTHFVINFPKDAASNPSRARSADDVFTTRKTDRGRDRSLMAAAIQSVEREKGAETIADYSGGISWLKSEIEASSHQDNTHEPNRGRTGRLNQ